MKTGVYLSLLVGFLEIGRPVFGMTVTRAGVEKSAVPDCTLTQVQISRDVLNPESSYEIRRDGKFLGGFGNGDSSSALKALTELKALGLCSAIQYSERSLLEIP